MTLENQQSPDLPAAFPSLDASFDEIKKAWDEMAEHPHEAVSYMQRRFAVKGRFEYDPGCVHAVAETRWAWTCRYSVIGPGAMGSAIDCILTMWHEERHQCEQTVVQFVSASDSYERDAWAYAFEQAKRHELPETPAFRHWWNTYQVYC